LHCPENEETLCGTRPQHGIALQSLPHDKFKGRQSKVATSHSTWRPLQWFPTQLKKDEAVRAKLTIQFAAPRTCPISTSLATFD
jgi:hypothetical protein